MRETDFHRSLRAVWLFLLELDVAEQVGRINSHTPSDAFKRAALANDPYPALFALGLAHSDYNFLLSDYSYFQFNYTRYRNDYGVRYAFYPNPHLSISFEEFTRRFPHLVENGDGREEYIQFLQEQSVDFRRLPIRFDIGFASYVELEHPAAHLHIGNDPDNRWPVSRELSPLAFALHIGKMYYRANWAANGKSGGRITNKFDDAFIAEKRICSQLGPQHLSRAEQDQLCWG